MAVDYKSFSTSGNSPDNPDGSFDKRWWLVDKKDRAQSVMKVVNFLAKNDTTRKAQFQRSERLYGNARFMGLSGLSYNQSPQSKASIADRVTYNVVQSAIDTVTAKIAKNKPKPLFLTSGGNFKMQRKAKKLDKFVDGINYENKIHTLSPIIFRDAAVYGDGWVHVFNEFDRVKYERVLAEELLTDWAEAIYGDPRQKHRVKAVDRDVLIDAFPKYKKEILAAQSPSADLVGANANLAEQLVVVESWHLASGPNAKDGLHSINIDGCNLLDEEWKKKKFPFARMPWCPALKGNDSQSLAQQIQSIQLEVNKILWVIQRSMHLMGTFKIWMKTGSKVVKEHINNELGTIIQGEEAPVYLLPPSVQPEYFQQLQMLKNAALEQAGVSQLSAQSQKPAGLNSGKALREFNDIESDRFMTIGQAYEAYHLELAELAIDVAKDIYEDKKKYEVKIPGKRFIQTIDWKDIDLEEDEYIMKIFPVSSLPNEPAGRLQTVQEYVQAGFIDPMTAQKLLDFPDLEQVESLKNSQEEWIGMYLDAIVDDGEYSPPEPEMNLDVAKQMTLLYIAQGHTNKLDPGRMDQLRTFNTQLQMLEAKATPPAPQPMPGQGAPQAAPMPQPQSDLIQNVPGNA